MESRNLKDKIILSKRNKPKVAYEGMFYNYVKTNIGKKYWRCNKRGCSSYLLTKINDDLISITDHNHLININNFNHTLLASKIKERALNCSESSRNVVSSTIPAGEFYKSRTLKELVQVTRSRCNFIKEDNYDVPIECQKTIDGQTFLQYDLGQKDPARILIFGTLNVIKHLKYSDIIICDGTFKTAPVDFEQLFTFQVKIREEFVPVCFCFMKKNDIISYERILRFLNHDLNIKFNESQSFILDFECASYRAIKNVLHPVKIFGCCFHLGQIVWRRIGFLDLSTYYKTNKQFKLCSKMILSLAFVPIEDVPMMASKLYKYIQNLNCTHAETLFLWFEKHFLDGEHEGNKNIIFWNVYQRTLINIPRTTNSLECYHRHLNSLVTRKLVLLNTILFELKKEQMETENFIISSLYMESNNLKKEDKIFSVVKNYITYNNIEYLIATALNINWKME